MCDTYIITLWVFVKYLIHLNTSNYGIQRNEKTVDGNYERVWL